MDDMRTQKAPLVPHILFTLALGSCVGVAPAQGAQAASATIESLSLAVSPLIPRGAQGERNILVASIDSAGLTDATLSLTSPNWPQPITQTVRSLPKGKQPVEIEVVPLAGPTPVTVRVGFGGSNQEFGPFTVVPPRKWTVYLTQHTHTDIGYTRPQTEILPEHLRYIDYALDYCDATDSLPDDARFRWTCETSWAVRQYLSDRPAAQIARLKQRVREGRIEICGLLLNMSEIATENSLAALVRPVRAITEEFGIPIRTAMQNDVNGAGWCLPDYFNGIGIRYLSMGINKTRSLLPFDKPTCFWWESPSGKRVLAYRSDHYMTANFWGVEKGDAGLIQPKVAEYLTSLEQQPISVRPHRRPVLRLLHRQLAALHHRLQSRQGVEREIRLAPPAPLDRAGIPRLGRKGTGQQTGSASPGLARLVDRRLRFCRPRNRRRARD